MNKTLKTIAWICLALGLLGTAVDAGALVFGRTLMVNRQAAAASGNVPAKGSRCIAEDTNNDGKPDGDCLQFQQPNQPGFGGQRGHGGMMFDNRDVFKGDRFGGRGIFPLFLMALGPILAVIGAVILLVNREPKTLDAKKEVGELKTVKKK